MAKILVLNEVVIHNIPDAIRILILPNEVGIFQNARRNIMQIMKHHHPRDGKDYYVINDIDNFVKKYKSKLTSYEIQEVRKYKEIYYFGENAPVKLKQRNGNKFQSSLFDHLDFRYEIWNVLGSGAYATVYECYDHMEREFVAVKVLSMSGFLKRYVKNEIEILEYIKKESDKNKKLKDLIVNYLRSFVFRGSMCIVFERMSCDVLTIIGRHNFGQDVLKTFTQMLMEGLNELKKLKVIHLDLKPNNLLVTSGEIGLKICDFGVSCFHCNLKRTEAEEQLIYYRSPEVILGGPIGPQIDMWAAGCIVVQLCTGRKFLRGENESDHLTKMMEVLGVPPLQLLKKCQKTHVYFHSNNIPKYCDYVTTSDGELILNPRNSPSGDERFLPGSITLTEILKNDDQCFHDFLLRCLQWDPSTRLTPEQALQHPYLTKRVPIVPTEETESIFPKVPIFVGKPVEVERVKHSSYYVTTKRHNTKYLSAPF